MEGTGVTSFIPRPFCNGGKKKALTSEPHSLYNYRGECRYKRQTLHQSPELHGFRTFLAGLIFLDHFFWTVGSNVEKFLACRGQSSSKLCCSFTIRAGQGLPC